MTQQGTQYSLLVTEHGVDDEEYCAGNGGGDADVGGK